MLRLGTVERIDRTTQAPMKPTATPPDRVDNLLGVFLRSRGFEQTSNGKAVWELQRYALRRREGKWVLLTMEDVALYDAAQAAAN